MVDVKEGHEYAGRHVPGARLMPMRQVSAGEVWVHCAGDYRAAIAAIAASLLAAAGHRVVAIDDECAAGARVGLPVVAAAA